MDVTCRDCGARLWWFCGAWFSVPPIPLVLGESDRCPVTSSPRHNPRPVDLARIRYEDAKAAATQARVREAIALDEYAEALADLELGESS